MNPRLLPRSRSNAVLFLYMASAVTVPFVLPARSSFLTNKHQYMQRAA